MTMGFKYQLLACTYPQELLQVTLNHLHQLREKVEEAKPVTDLVDEVIRNTQDKYGSMSSADYGALKQARAAWPSPPRSLVRLHPGAAGLVPLLFGQAREGLALLAGRHPKVGRYDRAVVPRPPATRGRAAREGHLF